MPDTTDPAASALQPIRDRAGIVAKLGPPRPGGDLINAAHRSAADVPRLLAAVEAALKLADHWDREGYRLDAEAFMVCAAALREAIAAALAEKEADDER